MKEYILLLPIIFIFHDMEEIIGLKRFFKMNPAVFTLYPRITKASPLFLNIINEKIVYDSYGSNSSWEVSENLYRWELIFQW